MKQKLKNIVKYSKPFYYLYHVVGNIGLAFLKLLVPFNDKLILFISFGGRSFDDSPRAIYEAIRRDKRFRGYQLVWALEHPEHYPQIKNRIKVDTLRYFVTALAAKVWITNSSVERGLDFKRKETLYFNTWHGTPIKKMGLDIAPDNHSFKASEMWRQVDVMTAQSDYEADVFSRVFHVSRERFLMCGLPRNDELVHYTSRQRAAYRKKLKIPEDKKAILYMPTFREFDIKAGKEYVFTPPINVEKWEEQLKENYVLLFRVHYEASRAMDIENTAFVRDVTFYPVLNELLIASDILISDYSSIFFDYSIMDKPMLYFTYDYEKYSELRGMYFDIREYLSGGQMQEELIDMLKNLDEEKELVKTKKFRQKYVTYYGSATKKAVDFLVTQLH